MSGDDFYKEFGSEKTLVEYPMYNSYLNKLEESLNKNDQEYEKITREINEIREKMIINKTSCWNVIKENKVFKPESTSNTLPLPDLLMSNSYISNLSMSVD